jgi:hypothetical protein
MWSILVARFAFSVHQLQLSMFLPLRLSILRGQFEPFKLSKGDAARIFVWIFRPLRLYSPSKHKQEAAELGQSKFLPLAQAFLPLH